MIVIVMGVVGAGKTTVGKLLAAQMHWEFADADDFHSSSNVEKIRNGIPLNDQDREPWLESLHLAIVKWTSEGKSAVLACSALKRGYRDRLTAPGVRFVYLRGDADLIGDRLRSRHGHFAGEAILASQLADLEEPENAVTVSIAAPPEKIVAEIRKQLGLG
jgi:gluconokinase